MCLEVRHACEQGGKVGFCKIPRPIRLLAVAGDLPHDACGLPCGEFVAERDGERAVAELFIARRGEGGVEQVLLLGVGCAFCEFADAIPSRGIRVLSRER